MTQLTLVTDAHGVPVLVRFPDGTDLAPAALIARLAAAADCAAALGAARADAAGLRVSVERLSAKRKAEDAEEIAALRAEVERLRRVIEIGRRVLGCRRNNPEMQVSAEWETGDAATIAALRSALQRFVVPGRCDEVRRGVAQCGGVCRWCEAARALEGARERNDG